MIRAAVLIRSLLVAAVILLTPLAVAIAQTDGAPSTDSTAPDYTAWETFATSAETKVENSETSDEDMLALRARLVEWRSAFLVAQSANVTRISTLRAQIEALGPIPEEGGTEAPEIAQRRTELNEQLVRLQAPGIAADEAHRRADGLIREIDRILRERQASELMRLWPVPINPANWPPAVQAMSDTALRIWTETQVEWQKASSRTDLRDNLPLVILFCVVGIGLIWRGRRLVENISLRLRERSAARWHHVLALVLSLGQIILPTIGLALLSRALGLTAMLGAIGFQLALLLPAIGFVIFSAIWLGSQSFPKSDRADAALNLSPEARAQGRLLTAAFGLLIALDVLRETVVRTTGAGDDVNSVLSFPIIVLGGIFLLRIGQLLRRHTVNAATETEQTTFRNRLIGLVGRAAIVIGLVGPVLGAVGYISAAGGIIYPAALSLGLVGMILVLQGLVDDLYALLRGSDALPADALAPTLVGFALTLASLPLFALIWGARPSDITELWTRFLEGFSIGETRISPTAFILFAVVFAIGYMITRLVQGALRSSVLPKTKLDQGGQKAILAGVSYIGIFLSGLIAINSAGINLAGIAVVAGALSVGIGFGLQTIVSNFVSGIILLVERPVSEGDWIEVGGVQGTVQSISVRSTRIQTFDRTDVIVPNNDLIAGRVTNWTRFNLSGRLIVPVGVAYNSDTREVEGILREIAEAQPLVVLNPPPLVVFMGFGPDSMDFEVRVILRDVNFSLSVRSDMNHEIVRRFREAGITIPFPQREIWLRRSEDAGGETPITTGPRPALREMQPEPDLPDAPDQGEDRG